MERGVDCEIELNPNNGPSYKGDYGSRDLEKGGAKINY